MQLFRHCLPFLGLMPLCVSSTAQELSTPFSIQDATDTLAIQQVINLYSIALDQKRFDLLPQIFSSDVTINFNTPGVPVLHGLPAVTVFVSTALRDVVTYHAQSTHSIKQLHLLRPHATTYNSAKFFGAGGQQGQIVSKWGRWAEKFLEKYSAGTSKLIEPRYEDFLVRTSRGWRISSRTLITTVSDLYIKGIPITYQR